MYYFFLFFPLYVKKKKIFFKGFFMHSDMFLIRKRPNKIIVLKELCEEALDRS